MPILLVVGFGAVFAALLLTPKMELDSFFYSSPSTPQAQYIIKTEQYEYVNQHKSYAIPKDIENIEQSLIDICKTVYFEGLKNGCVNIDSNFTWAFLTQDANASGEGMLINVRGYPKSSTFNCAEPEKYGTDLIDKAFDNRDITKTTYSISGINNTNGEPCGYDNLAGVL